MRISFSLGLLVALTLVACGQGGPTAPSISASTVIIITNGDRQTDTVAKRLGSPIVARAMDSLGILPIKGVVISWVVTSGGGAVFAPTTVTGDSGFARQRWTLGTTAGAQTLEARAIDPNTGAAITFASVTATAVPGPLYYGGFKAKRALILGDSLWSLPVDARDKYGNQLTNVPIVGLDGARPDSTGRWLAYPVGVSRFQLTSPTETDTLTVLVTLPASRHYDVADTVSETGRLYRQPCYTLAPGCQSLDSLQAGSCGVVSAVNVFLADSVAVKGSATAMPNGQFKVITGLNSAGRFTMMFRPSYNDNCNVLRQDTLAGRWVFKMRRDIDSTFTATVRLSQ